MRFRLVPTSATLDDLELLYVQIFAEFCARWHVWEATTAKRMKIDPHCLRGNCCALKVLFNDIYYYWLSTDIKNEQESKSTYRLRWYCWAIQSVGRFSELRTIYQGCRALPFALARLSCWNVRRHSSRKVVNASISTTSFPFDDSSARKTFEQLQIIYITRTTLCFEKTGTLFVFVIILCVVDRSQ